MAGIRLIAILGFIFILLYPIQALHAEKKFTISRNAYIRQGDFYKPFAEKVQESASALVASAVRLDGDLLITAGIVNPGKEPLIQGRAQLWIKNSEQEDTLLAEQDLEEIPAGEKLRILITIPRGQWEKKIHPARVEPARFRIRVVFPETEKESS